MQDQSQMSWDVIVVGSGAGAMTSAVVAADRGLSVLVIEKSDKFGGTSAISGGGIWIPNNHYFKAKGGAYTRENFFGKYANTKQMVSSLSLFNYLG